MALTGFNKIIFPSDRSLPKWTYLCCIHTFKKYLFGLLVAVYVISAAGIPIYLHYCGGALEKVSYVLKSNSCCDEDEDTTEDSNCCKNESVFLKNVTVFTLKQADHDAAVNTLAQLFYIALPFEPALASGMQSTVFRGLHIRPPDLQQSRSVQTTVLRI